jgi:hypothetical protein
MIDNTCAANIPPMLHVICAAMFITQQLVLKTVCEMLQAAQHNNRSAALVGSGTPRDIAGNVVWNVPRDIMAQEFHPRWVVAVHGA